MSSEQLLSFTRRIIQRSFTIEEVYCRDVQSITPAPPRASPHTELVKLPNTAPAYSVQRPRMGYKSSAGHGEACRTLEQPLIRASTAAEPVHIPDVLMAQQLFRYAAIFDCDSGPDGVERDASVCMALKTPSIDPQEQGDISNKERQLDFFLRRGLGTILSLKSTAGLNFTLSSRMALPDGAPPSMAHNLAGPLAHPLAGRCDGDDCAPHFVLFGGQTEFAQVRHSSRFYPKRGTGIMMAMARSSYDPWTSWSAPRMIISGKHPGCVE